MRRYLLDSNAVNGFIAHRGTIAAVQGEIDGLEAELQKTRAEINKHLRELGLVK